MNAFVKLNFLVLNVLKIKVAYLFRAQFETYCRKCNVKVRIILIFKLN